MSDRAEKDPNLRYLESLQSPPIPEVLNLAQYAVLILDTDGTAFKNKGFHDSSWLAFTYHLAKGLGLSDEVAQAWSDKHGKMFQEFLARKQGINPDHSLKYMADQLLYLWTDGGKRKIHQDVLKDVVEELRRDFVEIKNLEKLKEWANLAIVTGSFNLVASLAASTVGVEDETLIVANANLLFDEEGYLKGFYYNPDEAEVKMRQVQVIVEDRKPNYVILVGDGSSDERLMKAEPQEFGESVLFVVRVIIGDTLQTKYNVVPDIIIQSSEDWGQLTSRVTGKVSEKLVDYFRAMEMKKAAIAAAREQAALDNEKRKQVKGRRQAS